MIKRERWNPLLCNYPDSEKINAVSEFAETLYTRLIARSDDNASYDADPTLLMCSLFAKRFKAEQIDVTKTKQMRDELVKEQLITLYKINGKEYLHINNCKKCIRSDIKPDIRFPELSEAIIDKEVIENGTKPRRRRNENGSLDSTTDSDTNKNKSKYLEYILLSDDEYKKLTERFGGLLLKEKIAALNDAIGSKGYKYKSHYFTILNWDRRDSGIKGVVRSVPKSEQIHLCFVDKKSATIEIQTSSAGRRFICEDCNKLYQTMPDFKNWQGKIIPKNRLDLAQLEKMILAQKANLKNE